MAIDKYEKFKERLNKEKEDLKNEKYSSSIFNKAAGYKKIYNAALEEKSIPDELIEKDNYNFYFPFLDVKIKRIEGELSTNKPNTEKIKLNLQRFYNESKEIQNLMEAALKEGKIDKDKAQKCYERLIQRSFKLNDVLKKSKSDDLSLYKEVSFVRDYLLNSIDQYLSKIEKLKAKED